MTDKETSYEEFIQMHLQESSTQEISENEDDQKV